MRPENNQNKTLSKDSNQKAVFTPLGASNHSTGEREPNDYYATDPKAAQLLLEVEGFSPVIWEPAAQAIYQRSLNRPGIRFVARI